MQITIITIIFPTFSLFIDINLSMINSKIQIKIIVYKYFKINLKFIMINL